jgi:DNA polymerase III epsilon subunit-like protein
MLNILFFDTETNGLPLDRRALTSDISNWPHILQISWTLKSYTETSSKTLETRTAYLKLPDGVTWNDDAAKFHKISKESVVNGEEPNEILNAFKTVVKKASVIVAHNLAFDKPVVRAAFYRLNSKETFSWWPTHEYCTMDSTKSLCRIPSKFAKPGDPWKWPTLPELYKYLFNTEIVGIVLHTAEGDTNVLIQCFDDLVARRVVPLLKWLEILRVSLPRKTL